ncbi:Trp-like ion channel [Schizosaccharomyces japonicus yFS275]|uniref:Trp-like ion channel n=1 Tax=Schizosaccharomyces japonicus (strain yFS275 / FY16936) TaxID=402676 RepID=B6K109_SCHJY|nr:Trp-like ion channel [Schizosaccharomyces japonicus yFS275]EEB07630.1 Trp-like ion channel [Schizosaccharomyces japonicus yFS275]
MFVYQLLLRNNTLMLLIRIIWVVLSLLVVPGQALIRIKKRPNHRLFTSQFTSCSVDSPLQFELFDATYYARNFSIVFNIYGRSSVDMNATLDISILAYGARRSRFVFDPCEINLDSFCPVTKDQNMFAQGVLPVSPQDADTIPSIAWSIPDFEGLVTFRVLKKEDLNASLPLEQAASEAQPIACMVASLANKHTFRNRAIVAVSAAAVGLSFIGSIGFLLICTGRSISFAHTTITHSIPTGLQVITLFQTIPLIAAVGVQHSRIFTAWASNFAWTLGFTITSVMENTINRFRNQTDMHKLQTFQTVSLDDGTDISVPRLAQMPGIFRGFHSLAIDRGTVFTNLFMYTFFWLLISIGIVVAMNVTFKLFMAIITKTKLAQKDSRVFVRKYWIRVTFSFVAKWLLMALPGIAVLIFYEFSLQEAWGPILLAALLLVALVALFTWSAIRITALAKCSLETLGNPRVLLFSHPNGYTWWGWMYLPFREEAWSFSFLQLLNILAQSLVLGLAQEKPKIQVILLLVFQVIWATAVFSLKPFCGRKNIGLIFVVFTFWSLWNAIEMLLTALTSARWEPKWLKKCQATYEEQLQPTETIRSSQKSEDIVTSMTQMTQAKTPDTEEKDIIL